MTLTADAPPDLGQRQPPPFRQPCEVCAAPYRVKPANASTRRRCPDCIAAGRARCCACDRETPIRPGQSSRGGIRCPECQASGRFAPGTRYGTPQSVTCVGVKVFEEVWYASSCLPPDVHERGHIALKQSKTYRTTGQFRCAGCTSLATLVQLLRRRQVDRFRDPVRSASRVRELLRENGRAFGASGANAEFLADKERLRARPRPVRSREAMARGQLVRAWRVPVAHEPGDDADAARGPRYHGVVPKMQIYTCRHPDCGKLILVQPSNGSQGLLHQHCLAALKREPRVRAWMVERWRLRKQGLTSEQIERRRLLRPFPIPERRGRPRDPAELTRNFGFAVRHLLAGEPIAALAREASLSRPTVSEAIKTIVALLPAPELADPRLRRYVLAFRAAQGEP